MDGGKVDGELEILSDVRVEARDIHVLYGLTFPRLSVSACPRSGPRTERPAYRGLWHTDGCTSSSGVYQHRQIRISTQM